MWRHPETLSISPQYVLYCLFLRANCTVGEGSVYGVATYAGGRSRTDTRLPPHQILRPTHGSFIPYSTRFEEILPISVDSIITNICSSNLIVFAVVTGFHIQCTFFLVPGLTEIFVPIRMNTGIRISILGSQSGWPIRGFVPPALWTQGPAGPTPWITRGQGRRALSY